MFYCRFNIYHICRDMINLDFEELKTAQLSVSLHPTYVFVSSKSKSHHIHSQSCLPLTDASSREYLARSSGSLGSEEDDRLSSASEGSFSYQLTDVADVNALARLQEESQ